MLYKIEKGIPIPEAFNKRHYGEPIYGVTEALRLCEVGDSFFIPTDRPHGAQRNAVQAARQLFREAGHVVTRIDEDGCRIWRVK